MKRIIYVALAIFTLASCELIEPADIQNPNVAEKDFLENPNAMSAWVNGEDRTLSETVGLFAECTELMSDNMMNDYTLGSKEFDKPVIQSRDVFVNKMSHAVAKLREQADFGLNTVAKADRTTTEEQLFRLSLCKGYSYLLAGEYFTGMPVEAHGPAKAWEENLNMAISTFNKAMTLADSETQKAVVSALQARAAHRLGNKQEAVEYAEAALNYDNNFAEMAKFDGKQNFISGIQMYTAGDGANNKLFGTCFQPLPRLDFLDPKYFMRSSVDGRSICIAKAEEPMMILAEAALSEGDLAKAKKHMNDILSLVATRPVGEKVDDRIEDRGATKAVQYPDTTTYRVRASSQEHYREGLVLNRRKLITVPMISGTSVTSQMIEQSRDVDSSLELLYLMRQEIFFSEGRRAADLGIRMPLYDVQINGTTNGKEFSEALIPDYIPLKKGMDAFDMDKEKKTVTIKYNMNKVLVEHKEEAIPFFKK